MDAIPPAASRTGTKTGAARYGPAGGYLQTAQVLNRAFNALLATSLVLVSAPLLALLYVLVWVTSGRPAIYRGTRLGLHRKPFTMYKFRTLVPDAEEQISAELLSSKHCLMTPLGRFLRDTRLDELPQLFNILKGDMDFVGPRPERPVIYEKFCRHIPGYDKRFSVRPALIGFSQLFTPHGSPKRIRTLVDNRLLARKQVLMWDAIVIALAAIAVLGTTLEKLRQAIRESVWEKHVRRRYVEKRGLTRIHLRRGTAVWTAPDGVEHRAQLTDLNEDAFLLRAGRRIEPPYPGTMALETKFRRHRRGPLRKRRALCRVEFFRESRRSEAEYEYVFRHQPISPLHYYLVHQYFLRLSVVDPGRLQP
ncbi:MAG: sugar transferase [Planctomycetes bacterium]|nr:sugar transferase [Planctomycetota bacterium]